MKYKLSKRSTSNLMGVDLQLIKIIEKGITDSPYDFGIPTNGGYRTMETQMKLYAQGRTRPGKKITYLDGLNKKSYHQTGKAFDIYIYNHETGKAEWDVKKITAVAEHLKAVAWLYDIELEWGGDWVRFRDYPHFQIK